MDRLIVEGGSKLTGTLQNAGSKNAALPILCAALLTRETVRLTNVPALVDVDTTLDVLRELGATAERGAGGIVEVSAEADLVPEAGWEHVRKMRGAVGVLGPLLARCGQARVSLPGGCVLGVRPIDLHLKGLAALGAELKIEHGFVVAKAPPGGLRGGRLFLGGAFGSSVLGTANVMMAACLARGTTVLEGAACEPEVVDLGRCLKSMGAKIEGLGSPHIEIEGVDELSGTEHPVIPDRIEAGTYLIAGLMTGGRVRIEGCRPEHHAALFDRLIEAGLSYSVGQDWIESTPTDQPRPRPTDVTTLPYPGFPTDLQAQWMAMMSLADGLSVITERIYPDRYMHLMELQRLGAAIRREGATAIVRGVDKLSGAPVTASDLRASAALVLAGLVADGETEVHRVYHIDRGYERIEERLAHLGARIRRE